MKKCLLIFALISPAYADESVTELARKEFQKANQEFNMENTKNELLPALAKKVEELNNRLSVESALSSVSQAPKNVRVRGSSTVFTYRPEAVYQVFSAPNFVTDIQLKPGENLSTAPSSGDTVRWNIAVMKSGAGERETTHLILKPLEEGVETNLIITTDQRVYQMKLKSSDWHMPAVSWNYPQDMQLLKEAIKEKNRREEPAGSLSSLFFDYLISGKDYTWKPVRVFDDGKKTYIQMSSELSSREAPVLFLEDGSEEVLVNYRVKGRYYIVDRLFDQAVLKVGPNSEVAIQRDKNETFFEWLF